MGMFDRAPMLLGPPHDLSGVGNKPVSVRTVCAIKTFQIVKIKQFASIKDQIVRAMDFRDSIDRETNCVIQSD
jgi:hypothetical protein